MCRGKSLEKENPAGILCCKRLSWCDHHHHHISAIILSFLSLLCGICQMVRKCDSQYLSQYMNFTKNALSDLPITILHLIIIIIMTWGTAGGSQYDRTGKVLHRVPWPGIFRQWWSMMMAMTMMMMVLVETLHEECLLMATPRLDCRSAIDILAFWT